MFFGSGIWCGGSAGVVVVVDGRHPGAKEGLVMSLLVLAIIAIVGVCLFGYFRTRNAR
jgi:hypothetical protein